MRYTKRNMEENMKYNILFRIEKLKLVDKLKTKIKNLRTYMDNEGYEYEIEIVFAGDVVKYFEGDFSDFIDANLDVALCNNALNAYNVNPINVKNIRTVKAGIGEIIEKKAEGWIEYTIE